MVERETSRTAPHGRWAGLLFLPLLFVTRADPASARQGQTQTPWSSLFRPFDPGTCPRAVDNISGLGEPPAAGVPWTHRPYCATLASSAGEKHCVFASAAYNLGTGVSVITTPDTAASLTDAVSDAVIPWLHRRHLAADVAAGEGARARRAYEVRDVPGKGKGVLATRLIRKFEVLMVGFPALVVHDTFFPRGDRGEPVPPPLEASRLYDRAIARLGDRERVLGLSRSGTGVGHVAEDVMRMNSFGVVINDVKHKALYPEVSRINHGCDPNAMGRLNSRTLSLDVIATRDIPAGEEVQISYIPVGLPWAPRQQALKLWGFSCTCNLCLAPDIVQEESDRRRERLVQLQYFLNSAAPGGDVDLEEMREVAAELEEIVEDERLVQKTGEVHLLLANKFYEAADFAASLRHARISSHYCERMADPIGPTCASLRGHVAVLEEWEAAAAAAAAGAASDSGNPTVKEGS